MSALRATRRTGRRVGLLLGVAGLVFLASGSAAWRALELRGFDALSRVAPPPCVDRPLVVVGIDDDAFEELGLRWPWPRDLHAGLVDALHEAGAAVIALELIFSEPSTPAADAALADAIRRAGNVVLAADQARIETAHVEGWRRVDPLPSLLEAGAVPGLATVHLDGDAVLRRLPTQPERFGRQVVRLYQQRTGVAAPEPPPQARIRFGSPRCPFRYASYYQALEPRAMLPEGFFRDRIVLVGLHVNAVPVTGGPEADRVATPWLGTTGRLAPGVQVQAAIVDTILGGRAVREVSRAGVALAMLGLLAAASLALAPWRPFRSGAVAGALVATGLGAAWLLFRNFELWLPVLPLAVGIALLYVGHGALAFLDEQRERQYLKRAFSHYVAPSVVDEIVAHPERLRLGGERREITILFSDLAGFTEIAEKMPPEQVSGLLNRHFSRMTALVLEHGGTLDKFIGDALMAFWGAPLADAEHALHACRCAVAMRAAARELDAAFRRSGLPPLSVRIGIHSGVAVVGNMGSEHRFDYTAVGDAVNLASRLEGANKGYGTSILLSEATARRVGGRLALRALGVVAVKGRVEAVEVHTIAEET